MRLSDSYTTVAPLNFRRSGGERRGAVITTPMALTVETPLLPALPSPGPSFPAFMETLPAYNEAKLYFEQIWLGIQGREAFVGVLSAPGTMTLGDYLRVTVDRYEGSPRDFSLAVSLAVEFVGKGLAIGMIDDVHHETSEAKLGLEYATLIVDQLYEFQMARSMTEEEKQALTDDAADFNRGNPLTGCFAVLVRLMTIIAVLAKFYVKMG